MSRSISFSIGVENQARVEALMARYPALVQGALARAINRTATGVKAAGIAEIRKKSALKPSYLRERIEVINRASASLLEGKVIARRRPTLLSRYPYRQKFGASKKTGKRIRKGVTLEVTRGQRKTLHSGFLVPLRRGKAAGLNGFGIALRDTVAQKLGYSVKGGVTARSYTVRHGWSVHDLFEFALPKVVPAMTTRFTREVDHEIAHALQKAGVSNADK